MSPEIIKKYSIRKENLGTRKFFSFEYKGMQLRLDGLFPWSDAKIEALIAERELHLAPSSFD